MKQYIYLDDVRTPTQGVGEDNQPWVVVRSYDEFVEKVNEIGLENIQMVSLDHDLGDSAMKEWHNNGCCCCSRALICLRSFSVGSNLSALINLICSVTLPC